MGHVEKRELGGCEHTGSCRSSQVLVLLVGPPSHLERDSSGLGGSGGLETQHRVLRLECPGSIYGPIFLVQNLVSTVTRRQQLPLVKHKG